MTRYHNPRDLSDAALITLLNYQRCPKCLSLLDDTWHCMEVTCWYDAAGLVARFGDKIVVGERQQTNYS